MGNLTSTYQNINVSDLSEDFGWICIELYDITVDLFPARGIYGFFIGFYGIYHFVGYLTPNPFLCK